MRLPFGILLSLLLAASPAAPSRVCAAEAPLAGPAAEAPRQPLSKLITEAEFRALATELSSRVDLFADVWRENPRAEFFGGTTRDYLYWLVGRFAPARDRAEAELIMGALRQRPSIHLREFVGPESDVDVVSDHALKLEGKDYGVKWLDYVKGERFSLATREGRDELAQGFVPVEKIRLRKEGFVPWTGFGNGIREIYSGHVTVSFATPEEFASTKYAQEKLNHEVLYALRYIRLRAMNYFRHHGDGTPDPALLFGGDPATDSRVQRAIRGAAEDPRFDEFLAQPKFREWLNATVKKSFGANTNGKAARLLLEHFGVDKLLARHPELVPFDRYVTLPKATYPLSACPADFAKL